MPKRPGWLRNALCRLHVGGRTIYVSFHAGRRWAERVRADPDMAQRLVSDDIRQIAPCAEVVNERPGWVPGEQEAVLWMLFGPDIVMPICDEEGALVAVTTLDRTSVGPEAREWRNETRKRKQTYRHLARKERTAAQSRRYADKFRVGRLYEKG